MQRKATALSNKNGNRTTCTIQNRTEHYGKFYPELPSYGVVGAVEIDRFSEDKQRFLLGLEKLPSRKYTLLIAKKETVGKPSISALHLYSDYFLCLISSPYLPEQMRYGWVRSYWIEPLTKFETYEKESFASMKEIFNLLKKSKNQEFLVKESPMQIFKRLKKTNNKF